MKITNDYPIYIDPTFDEICELAKSKWDTIRICRIEDLDCIILASGYGNTHASLVNAVKSYFNLKSVWIDNCAIIWYRNNIAYMSEEGESQKHFNDKLYKDSDNAIIKDLIRESGLSLCA
jgi:hypothetical protein